MSDLFVASYVLLWVIVATGLVVVLGTARQVALLTRRFPFVDVVNEPGPDLGQAVPAVEAVSLAGEAVLLKPPFANRNVLVFMENGCSVCDEVLSEVRRVSEEAPDIDLWVVLEAEPSDKSVFRDGLARQSLIASSAFGAWKITTVPYACIVTEDGTLEAKGQLLGAGRLREALGLSVDPVPEEAPDQEAQHELSR
jgi:methylamine dehydrogenase accessory protein MauD